MNRKCETNPNNIKLKDVIKLFNEMKNLLEELKKTMNQMSIENKAPITKSKNTTEQRIQLKTQVVASATETYPYTEPIKQTWRKSTKTSDWQTRTKTQKRKRQSLLNIQNKKPNPKQIRSNGYRRPKIRHAWLTKFIKYKLDKEIIKKWNIIMIQEIIQQKCQGLKPDFNDWLLLISNQLPTIICLQETYLKSVDKIKIKNFIQYNYSHDSQQRASGGVSILIRNDIPQSKIQLETNIQAVAIKATLHRTINICSIYIPSHNSINETELNKIIEQLQDHSYY